jgi:hypothetical protein
MYFCNITTPAPGDRSEALNERSIEVIEAGATMMKNDLGRVEVSAFKEERDAPGGRLALRRPA